ncbi:DUF4123 domain-containing protein [Paracoccus caeni]|uniref:DUF4123 domain-containing protein n=1 Tax=Paracoccus caeni TaxID=657651 RepID=A0A934VYN1_9RHOB|nr:DUF4123 domain-containing protein [Paracoccus caeni]MBK4216167.1 DUF4123 domain-containing protein [Paracoccus caeni]
MIRTWIGDCHLRARSAERQRWIGGHEEARGLLLLSAASREDYEAGLSTTLLRLGYDLLSVFQASPVEDAKQLINDKDGLAELIPRVSRNRPLPFGGFHQIDRTNSWLETNWEEVLTSGYGVWAIIDGVSWPDAQKVLFSTGATHACLYSTLNPESRSLAPWLALVEPGSKFAQALQSRPHADNSYILICTNLEMDDLRKHLRKFTMLRTPENEQAAVYFRFYDPRVLIDMVEAMRSSFLARFTEQIGMLIAPISPLCLNPTNVEFMGDPITAFAENSACQGRLLSWVVPEFKESRSIDLSVSTQEFRDFTKRMQRRATIKLARTLHEEHSPLADQNLCLSTAIKAQAEAKKYGMNTVKQITIFARAMLVFGEGFETRDQDAARILNDSKLLPWQKKNQLIDWFISAWQRESTAHLS